ncbi:CinA family protein [Isoptericola sp. G70]|uniref:CinA family protein n=1 Tax=Isoptericola sp. G70 TaxID=3376633 RepID=UPI003A7F6976
MLLSYAAAQGWTIGVAESLTGGLVTASLVEVPGASTVVRGGVVAYATELKATLLGVDAGLLDERGAVDPDVAEAMARGVRQATGADVGLATTGVAGPDPQDGRPPGLVFVAVVTPVASAVRRFELGGDRAAVRRGAVDAVLTLAEELVDGEGSVSAGR